jgi:ABC-type multidrug transport system permease subunit
MASYHPLRSLYLTRLREFYRQPARLFWVYGFPTVLALGLGMAFRSPPAPIYQADLVDNPAASTVQKKIDDIDTKRKEGDAKFVLKLNSKTEALRRLRVGKTPLVIEPQESTSGGVIYHFDPTRAEAVAARAAFDDALQRAAGRKDSVPTLDEKKTEPGGRYIDFLIPGLIGQNTMGGGLWGVGFLLVNFRIGKLLKRFAATPMPRRDFLLAILLARLTFLVPDVAVLLLMGVLVFGMPIVGSLWLVALIEVIGALAFAGIGLLIASRAQTTETVSGLMNFVMLPMWVFSGLFFSSERFPQTIQPFIQALPLTQLLNALRRVMLEGAGLFDRDILISLGILAAWAVGTFALALRRFRWT